MQKRRLKGEGAIYQVKNRKNYFVAQISIGKDRSGKRLRETITGSSKKEVFQKMQKALFLINTDSYSKEKIYFGEFFENWFFNYKKLEIKPNSFARYESLWRLKIKDYPICNIKLKDLKTIHFQNHINSLLSEQLISVDNGKRLLNLFSSCLNWAIDHEFLFKNYCKGVKLPKQIKIRKNISFSYEEQMQFIDYLDTKNTVDLLILTTFYSGLRLGEITALTWEDFQDNYLNINKQYQNEYKINNDGTKTRQLKLVTTKTESSIRLVPIPKNIVELLVKHKERQDNLRTKLKKAYKNNNLIFADDIGNPIEHKRPNRRVKQICKESGIPEKTFHGVRHSYASRLYEMSVNVKSAQSLLGHSNYQTTMNIYTHISKTHLEKEINKFDLLANNRQTETN